MVSDCLVPNKVFKIVFNGVFLLDADVGFLAELLLGVDSVAATDEAQEVTLIEDKRDGTVTEPEEEDSDGDPGQDDEPGGEVLAGVSGS